MSCIYIKASFTEENQMIVNKALSDSDFHIKADTDARQAFTL